MRTPHLLLRGGLLLEVESNQQHCADLRVRDGIIAEIGAALEAEDAEVVEAAGCYVSPGWVDLKAQFGEPGLEYRETIKSGAAAAAAGGFTTVVLAPGTQPPMHTRDVVEYVRERARDEAVDVLPVGCITKSREGKELAELADLAEGGAVAFSDGSRYVGDAGLMRRAFEYARMLDRTVFVHPDQADLSGKGMMHEGAAGTRAGMPGIPAVAEEVALARDLLLAEYTGARVHLQHVTTARGLAMVREARARAVQVTAAATVLHATRSDEAVEATLYDPTTKLRPPLRPQADVDAVRAALSDGTLDALFSDHTPYAVYETEVEFGAAPFGVTGLETLWSVVVRDLIETGALSLQQAIALLTSGPRRVLGMPPARLEQGASANFTVFDTETRWTYNRARSKSRNSPFWGQELKGRVHAIYNRGRLVRAQ